MMTRKDYVAVSEILSDYAEVMPPEEYLDLVRDFALMMKKDNDRFDNTRFFEACGIDIPKVEYQPKSALSHVAIA
jgi:hypothetical protein